MQPYAFAYVYPLLPALSDRIICLMYVLDDSVENQLALSIQMYFGVLAALLKWPISMLVQSTWAVSFVHC